MKNMRNRKRMTGVVALFMLIFLVGAAFAAAPGTLDISGLVGVSDPELLVEWTAATPTANTAVATTNAARITEGASLMSIAEPRHSIEWAVGFINTGTVTLTATATNLGNRVAVVNAPSTTWLGIGPSGVTPTITGVTVDGTAVTFPFTLPVGDAAVMTVTLSWDGTVAPAPPPPSIWLFDQLDDDYDPIAWFRLELVYELAP